MLILGLGLAIVLTAAAPAVAPRTVRGWGLVLLCLSLVCISWNAVHVAGSVQPADLLLVAALGLALADALRRHEFVRIPLLAGVGAGLIGLAGLLSALLPATEAYLSRRYEFVNPYQQYGGHEVGGSNLSQLTKFEIAMVVLPVTVMLLRPVGRELRALGDCFVVSAVVSSLVGISDTFGFSAISPKLIGYTDITGRASGLTIQPNHLAASVVLSLPLVMHWFLRRERRFLALPVAAILLTAIYCTGSRGGCVVAVVACLGCFVAFAEFRRRAWFLLAAVPVMLVLHVPQMFLGALQNRVGAQQSDNQRGLLRQQGISDFLTHPLHGIGFQNVTSAHEVHIQLLAAGGVLAFLGYFLYLIAVGRALRPLVALDSFAAALAVILGCVFAMHFVENQLTDRYLFVPFALTFGLVEAHRQQQAEQDERASTGPPAPDDAPAEDAPTGEIPTVEIPPSRRASVQRTPAGLTPAGFASAGFAPAFVMKEFS
jgi:hypothetical protein